MSHRHRSLVASAAVLTAAGNLLAQPSVIVRGDSVAEPDSFAAQPFTSLRASALQLRAQTTIGDTLNDLPGVASSFFGPGASKPVIRGLEGTRVRVLSDGSGLFDAAATGPDHGNNVDSTTAFRIDLIRGPAAVRYGSNAVGGLVNVLTNRIPEQAAARPIGGMVDATYSTAGDGRNVAGILEGGWKGFQYHFDAAYRTADSYSIPGTKRSAILRAEEPLPAGESETRGTLPDTQFTTKSIASGLSYVWERGFIGISATSYSNRYGVPNEEEGVIIKLQQRRYDLRGQFRDPLPGITSIRYGVSFGNFRQSETGPDDLEGPGIVFKSRGAEGRLELAHAPVAGFTGLLGYHAQQTDFQVLGEQSFQPRTNTLNQGIFLFEERRFGPLRAEVGLRYEHQSIEADPTAEQIAQKRKFDTFNAALGLVWQPTADCALTLSFSYTQRPPTALELFADGPYNDIGRFVLGTGSLKAERSLALDLGVQKRTGWVTGSVNFFFYHFENFVSLQDTGGFDDENQLAIARYRGVPADFIGFEAEAQIHLLGPVQARGNAASKARVVTGKELAPAADAASKRDLYLDLRADYTRAENTTTGEPLPRISPLRLGGGIVFQDDRITARLDYRRHTRQNRTAAFETPTPGYNDLSASLEYRFTSGPVRWSAFVKGSNLTNADQRNSASFIKDFAPLPGRAGLAGLRATF